MAENKIIDYDGILVTLSGSAAMGAIGKSIGTVDIGESDESYLFRVALPDVSQDEKDFSCNIEAGGKIVIKGITMPWLKYPEEVCIRRTLNFCPPGEFTVEFKLPGPVSPKNFKGEFFSGILEGVVQKAGRN